MLATDLHAERSSHADPKIITPRVARCRSTTNWSFRHKIPNTRFQTQFPATESETRSFVTRTRHRTSPPNPNHPPSPFTRTLDDESKPFPSAGPATALACAAHDGHRAAPLRIPKANEFCDYECMRPLLALLGLLLGAPSTEQVCVPMPINTWVALPTEGSPPQNAQRIRWLDGRL